MKYDYYEIKFLEEENDAISLFHLRKIRQYLYVKISKRYPEKIFTIPITMQNGRRYGVKFVKNVDLEEVKRHKRSNNINVYAKFRRKGLKERNK